MILQVTSCSGNHGHSKTCRDDSGKKINRFTSDNAKSKIDKFPKITNWVGLIIKEHHSEVQLNSFPMNGHTLEFAP